MAVKKRSSLELMKAAQTSGAAIQEQDRSVEARSLQSRMTSLPLAKIIDRHSDTRDLNQQHVEELIVSISVLGLLEPLVVDLRGRLLAGGHRRAAIALLKERMLQEYAEHFPDEAVPVRAMDFDAEVDPDLALQIEVAENEKRRDYTRAEVRKLAERLKLKGYVDTKGRPALGERALRPALEVIIGKSQRTVRRYLNEEGDKKSGSTDLLFSETMAIASLRASLSKWQKAHGGTENEILAPLDREVGKLVKKLDSALKQSRQRDVAAMEDGEE
jgi:ParB family transcriptional regulator, chromosome partitioning protein